MSKPLDFKVSPKGAVSVYGLQRFPVTLYREQWERLAENMPAIQAFIQENGTNLSTKDKPKDKPRWLELEEQEEKAKAQAILEGRT